MHFLILWIKLSNNPKYGIILELLVHMYYYYDYSIIVLLYNYNFYLVMGCFLGYGLVRRVVGP